MKNKPPTLEPPYVLGHVDELAGDQPRLLTAGGGLGVYLIKPVS